MNIIMDPVKDISSVLAALNSNQGVLINELELDRILTDTPTLRYLIRETDDRISVFNESVRLMEEIPYNRNLKILIDFDALVAFLEQETNEGEAPLEINHLFYSSEIPYALPAGTFIELKRFLARRF